MSINVKYTTNEEKFLIQGIQLETNALPNGIIGNQTLSEIAKIICPNIFPRTLEMYSMPVIIGKDIIPFDPNGSLEHYANSISGSFTNPRGTTPCSILINNGKDFWSYGSKSWAGFRESTIVRYFDGTTKIVRVLNTSEIPDRTNVKWAVGGMGLLENYDPYNEGFRTFIFNGKEYNHGDVLRDTNHNVLGIKDNFCYLVFCKSMSSSQVNDFCKYKMNFNLAIMLDGGEDITAINGAESFAKINITRVQGYAIQAI